VSNRAKLPTARSSIGARRVKARIELGVLLSSSAGTSCRTRRSGTAPSNTTLKPAANGGQPSMPVRDSTNGPVAKPKERTLV
jgi:hypothetical protein